MYSVTQPLTQARSHSLLLRKSIIPSAGRGCFLVGGSVPRGGIVTLCPGMVYCNSLLPALSLDLGDDAFDTVPPLFMVGNSYLLRVTADGREYLVDGSPGGLSALVFGNAAASAREANIPINSAWLDPAGEACGRDCGTLCGTFPAGSSWSDRAGQPCSTEGGTHCSTSPPGPSWMDLAV